MSFLSTASPHARWTFLEAALHNAPEDGGLFLPAELAPLPDLDALLDLPWHARNGALMHQLTRAFDADWWERRSREALDFAPAIVDIAPGLSALELFHGPSLAFKDYGVGLLAAAMARLEHRPRLVLCATSGDTGAAVARAFLGREPFRAAILYPVSGVSPMQERQIAALGRNVSAFAVDGDFDTCQRLVASAFADQVLSAELGLLSANSIHVLRLLAQVLYYAEAWARLRPRAPRLAISVPSGNFGNLCAGILARRIGLPLDLIAATNANRTVPDFLDGGPWSPQPTVATLSNAMDIRAPNNWTRIVSLFGGRLGAMRNGLRWGSLSDSETLEELRALRAEGYTADPHSAVASGVLRRVRRDGEHGLFLATAHPAKFRESLRAELGWDIPLPPALAALEVAPVRRERMPPDSSMLRSALRALPQGVSI
jgi:threonine synthase